MTDHLLPAAEKANGRRLLLPPKALAEQINAVSKQLSGIKLLPEYENWVQKQVTGIASFRASYATCQSLSLAATDFKRYAVGIYTPDDPTACPSLRIQASSEAGSLALGRYENYLRIGSVVLSGMTGLLPSEAERLFKALCTLENFSVSGTYCSIWEQRLHLMLTVYDNSNWICHISPLSVLHTAQPTVHI